MQKAVKLSSADKLVNIAKGFQARKVTIKGPSTGKAEVHEFQHDLYVALTGRAIVQVGKLIGEIEKIAEGEFRSNSIEMSEQFEMQTGDILLIPAGLAHRVIINESYQQWVFKLDYEH
ncbi:cupin domain-containing protein [Thermotoga profunda]|uniref:hypothetical protein n=1 Tax=Thermotoga profunda TaxID=1508420 RepID=UPI000597905A|nr:hypothetical protein [Thermotoga profunda]